MAWPLHWASTPLAVFDYKFVALGHEHHARRRSTAVLNAELMHSEGEC